MIKKRIITLMLGALTLFALFSLARCDMFVEYVRITEPVNNSSTYDSLIQIRGYAQVNLDYYDTLETDLYINGFYVASNDQEYFTFLALLDHGYNTITVRVYKNGFYWLSNTVTVYNYAY